MAKRRRLITKIPVKRSEALRFVKQVLGIPADYAHLFIIEAGKGYLVRVGAAADWVRYQKRYWNGHLNEIERLQVEEVGDWPPVDSGLAAMTKRLLRCGLTNEEVFGIVQRYHDIPDSKSWYVKRWRLEMTRDGDIPPQFAVKPRHETVFRKKEKVHKSCIYIKSKAR